MNRLITLTTDFGTGSPYVAQMRGVILSIDPTITVVDISHAIPPQDVRQGAIVLEDVSPLFPPDTLHVAVVDPGVGSERNIVFVRAGGQAYIAPDNGLLSRVARRSKPETIFALTEPRFWRQPVSSTFHGRDIMAPAAAHICSGAPPETLGVRRREIADLDWPEVRMEPDRIAGTILQIDSFGNLITDISSQHLARVPQGRTIAVSCSGHRTELVDHYSQQSKGALLALVGSNGRLELSLCGGNASRSLGVGVGEPVEVTW